MKCEMYNYKRNKPCENNANSFCTWGTGSPKVPTCNPHTLNFANMLNRQPELEKSKGYKIERLVK